MNSWKEIGKESLDDGVLYQSTVDPNKRRYNMTISRQIGVKQTTEPVLKD